MSIFIGLGANLPSVAGAPQATLEAALARLAAAGVRILRRSRWYSSPAWPDPSDPEFVNAVVEAETPLDARALLRLLHEIEAALGRERGAPNAPRTIDLDLLDYRGAVEAGPEGPVLPHPRLHQRASCRRRWGRTAPGWPTPVGGRGIAELTAAFGREAVAGPLG